jgi:GxxExxY protein
MRKRVNLLYEELIYEIIGVSMEFRKTSGQGYLEAVYEEALAYEFQNRNISFERQKSLPKNTHESIKYVVKRGLYDTALKTLCRQR